MKVLLITFSFPPAGGVGVLRALSLARYLPESGIRVDVLSARNAPAVGKDASLLQQLPRGVQIHRCWTLDLPFTVRKRVKRLLSRPSSTSKPALVASAAEGGRPSFLRTLIANLLLPDPQVGWLPFAVPAAGRLIRKRAIDLVLITVPPFSSVKLVTRLRKDFPSLPIVLDFRDEWLTSTIDLVSFNGNDRARAVAHQAEAEAVRAATAVVLVTEAAQRELRLRYPQERADKFHYVPNGFETMQAESVQPSPRSAGDPVIITYLGSIYGSTDPSALVQAVHQLSPEVRARLKLRFIGHVETAAYREALVSLGERVELTGFIPQAKALQAMEHSDYLLLITRDPINVSAKFYDYLSAGKPILAAVRSDGEVRRRLEETRSGWWADIHDPAAIRQMLQEAVERADSGAIAFHPDAEAIARYHRRPIAQRYAALLRSLGNGEVSA